MRIVPHRLPSPLIYALALAGLVVSIGATEISGFDVWWHLATGWVITHLKTIPHHDLFSYTAFGAPWVNHQWLFQVLQWLVYERFDVAGMVVIKLIILGGTSAILFRLISLLSANRNMAMWGVVLFVWSASNRVMNRPLMIVLLLLAVYVLILHRYVREGGRLIWLLPPLQVIWINSHGGGLLGPLAIFAFALGESAQPLCRRFLGGPEPMERARRHRLWLVALMSLAACLVNPWGADVFWYYGDLNKLDFTLRYTQEWLTPLHPQLKWVISQYLYLLCAAAAFASHILSARRLRLSSLFLSAGTVMLLARGSRFGPEMMIANLPILAQNLSERFPALGRPSMRNSWASVAAAAIISAFTINFGVPVVLNRAPQSLLRLGAPGYSAPARMVDFLEYHNIRGKVFNDLGLGAYLIFRRWPGELVFIDGRTPIYGEEFFIRFVDALMQSVNFERLLRQYQFDYIVLASYHAWELRQVHEYLWKNPEWRLVYAMDDGYVYLRNVPRFRRLIEKLALKRHPVVEEIERRQKEGGKDG